MDYFSVNIKNKKAILALGAESDGNFSVYKNGKIYFSQSFDDLLEEKNFLRFKRSVLDYLKKNKIKPNVVITDTHPLYKTTLWGEELAKIYKIKHIQVQHHIAHIFSAIGEKIIENCKLKIENCLGIACDGTGHGTDGKIWGGEVFKLKIKNEKLKIIGRVGHLEDQVMIGGDLAVREPARMLLAILARIKNYELRIKNNKEFVYTYLKKYYTRNESELLYNQLQQNFNCVETSSTGRVLDAVSVLLGFAGNKRNYKHEAAELLEKNSAKPYRDIKPVIKSEIQNYKSETNSKFKIQNSKLILKTTPLFEYLIKNLNRDKKRLAATAQLYIAQGLYEILKKFHNSKFKIHNSYFAGGITNNKIISSYLEGKGVYTNKKIPRGDAGLSFGQIIYHLFRR